MGFPGYDQGNRLPVLEAAARQDGITLDEAFKNYAKYLDPVRAEPIAPAHLYENVFMIGMVAETGHFIVKQEGYADFREGHDLESAEMMLFDIIDETAHVQYAHKWLPLLGEVCGVDNSNYRERAAAVRAEYQQRNDDLAAELARTLSRTPGDPAYDFYCDLLARIRRVKPLANAASCPPRSPKPM